MTGLASRKNRKVQDRIVLEGRRLIADALESGLQLENIYFTLEESLQGLPLDRVGEGQLKKVFYKKMKVWSNLTTCPGIMAIFRKPTGDAMLHRAGVLPLTVICDNVRDPGNMGAILRSVAAAGCRRILLMKGCVDVWESKVLRSGSGAHFRFPIYNNVPWEHLPSYIEQAATVYLADNRHESTGLQAEAEASADEEEEEEEVEETEFTMKTEEGRVLKVDKLYLDPNELESARSYKLQCKEYTEVEYNQRESVLVVGGETHGLSPQSFLLARNYGGMRVHIPSDGGVESLNTAVAASVLIFEIRRQLSQGLLDRQGLHSPYS
ncbi:rRNA methyltransferase 3, mitochondrial-like [Ornithodoros turicata]|uniref:rRNA methyltransferase 3, mitochondrial-like n=1 Tax=Ornithodoros turicata TaxID=34597 RepID=UPI003139FBF4